MKSIITTLFASFLSITASAAESRLTVNLDWRHLPRINADLAVNMRAEVPGAAVIFRRWESGLQSFDVIWSNGSGSCAAQTSKGTLLQLKCESKDGYYWVTKAPNKNAVLEWVQDVSF